MECTLGVVIERRTGAALVALRKAAFCRGCAARGACGVGNGSRAAALIAADPLGAGGGDFVRLAVSSSRPVLVAALRYGVPAVVAVAGAAVGLALGPAIGVVPDLAAAVGLLVATALTVLATRRRVRGVIAHNPLRIRVSEIVLHAASRLPDGHERWWDAADALPGAGASHPENGEDPLRRRA